MVSSKTHCYDREAISVSISISISVLVLNSSAANADEICPGQTPPERNPQKRGKEDEDRVEAPSCIDSVCDSRVDESLLSQPARAPVLSPLGSLGGKAHSSSTGAVAYSRKLPSKKTRRYNKRIPLSTRKITTTGSKGGTSSGTLYQWPRDDLADCDCEASADRRTT